MWVLIQPWFVTVELCGTTVLLLSRIVCPHSAFSRSLHHLSHCVSWRWEAMRRRRTWKEEGDHLEDSSSILVYRWVVLMLFLMPFPSWFWLSIRIYFSYYICCNFCKLVLSFTVCTYFVSCYQAGSVIDAFVSSSVKLYQHILFLFWCCSA